MSETSRRDTLKLISLGAAAAACSPSRHDGRKPSSSMSNHHLPASAAEAILSLTPLGFPWRTHDPFLFCVHHDDHYPAGNAKLGPAASLAGRQLGEDFAGLDGWRMYHGKDVPGFPQHPHRGFETVTVVRQGLLDHSDSLGATARYGGGDVQWLTAGGGILHAEMFPLLAADRPNPLELFQIWLNLPRARKMVPPHFTMFWNKDIPRRIFLDHEGRPTEVTVVAGSLEDTRPLSPPPSSWASEDGADVAIWSIRLAPGATWTLPPARPGSHRSLYFFRGRSLRVAGREVPPAHEIELAATAAVTLETRADDLEVELLLLQGRPIGEPVVQYGPFVMNTRQEIQQAFADYQRTQFGGWPWPSHEPVHAREEGRFALHADGRLDRPT